MIECPHCGWKSPEAPRAPICPGCGMRLNGLMPASRGIVRGYFLSVWEILTQPTRFFRSLSLQGGLARPLAFALITHWIGAALAYLWHMIIGGSVSDLASRFFRMAGEMSSDIESTGRDIPWNQVMEARDRLMHWFWGAGSVIGDPFYTLASILFTSLFVFAGARLLVTPGRDGAPREITYESAVRLVCYGMTPAILAGIPLFGWGLASLLTMIITVIGAREIYRIGVGRAIVVALFPRLLFIALLMAGVFILAVVALKFFTSFL